MIVVNTFQSLNNEMQSVYKELDKKMKSVLIEPEFACADVIDGPRHDLTELLSTILSPTFEDTQRMRCFVSPMHLKKLLTKCNTRFCN